MKRNERTDPVNEPSLKPYGAIGLEREHYASPAAMREAGTLLDAAGSQWGRALLAEAQEWADARIPTARKASQP
jgi:hypothetical protein